MKTTFLILLSAILFLFVGCKPSGKESVSEFQNNSEEARNEETTYDQELAQKLGADDYGMKTYIFALLKAGPNREQDSTSAARIQRGHMENITRMAEEGTLVAAGPFLDSGDFQGIFVFNVESVEEAEALTKTDPAVQAGRLVFEFYPWYSSATLQLIGEWHKKVAKLNP